MTELNEGMKFDQDKLRYELIPTEATAALAQVLTFGAKKYADNADNGWQQLDNAESRYTGALLRHIEAWRGGEKNDPESGMPHLWHAITNLAFLVYFEEHGEKELASAFGPEAHGRRCLECQNRGTEHCERAFEGPDVELPPFCLKFKMQELSDG